MPTGVLLTVHTRIVGIMCVCERERGGERGREGVEREGERGRGRGRWRWRRRGRERENERERK